jgi:hypothetical protein
MTTQSSLLSPERLAHAYTYDDYKQLIQDLLASGKTTGPNQSEKMTEYTELNLQRMRRLEKTSALTPALEQKLQNLQHDMIWLVLTEGWCGDAAQNMPLMKLMADATDAIDLRVLLRDENLDLMDQFLTDGGRGIPKLIALDAHTLQPLGSWGPRPEPAQNMVREFKQDPKGRDYSQFVEELQKWYNKDHYATMQQEFLQKLDEWQAAVPAA